MNHEELLSVTKKRRRRNGKFRDSLAAADIDTSVMYTTPNALAKKMGVSPTAIHYLILDGKCKAFKFGSRIFIHPDQEKLVENLAKSGLIFRVKEKNG